MKNWYIYNDCELGFKKGLISICVLYLKYSDIVVLFDEQTKIKVGIHWKASLLFTNVTGSLIQWAELNNWINHHDLWTNYSE